MIMLPETIVCKAVLEPQTFLGCDRELSMTLAFFCVGLAVSSADLLIGFISLGAFITGMTALRMMARRDLKLRHVYVRQLKYRSFYRAQATLYSVPFKKYRS